MSDLGKAVFLSYASQDADAAKKICEALSSAGVEVWFDRSELRGGDSWDQNIRKQIKECALFLPVVSANTQARREGYFRLEWKLADDRTHLMAKGTPFLVPVCVDDTKDWDALVPDSFMTVQWTRLPGGETTPRFCERVQALLRGEVAPARPRAAAHAETPVSPATSTPSSPKKFPVWALAAGAVVVIGAGLFVVTRSKPPTPSSSAAAENVSAPLRTASPATAEIPRDPNLKRVMSLIFGLDAIPEDFALAEDILKPLVAARPNDPDVATVSAVVAQEFLTRGFDVSQARRSSVQRLTERAVQLAPDNPDALAALGRYFVFIDAQMPRAEELLRRAIALRPDEPRYYRTLLGVLASRKPGTETEVFVADMSMRFPKVALVRYDIARHYKDTNNVAAMEQAMDETLALAPVSSAMVWKSWLALEAHGDGPGMKAWLDRVPERQRATTRVASAHVTFATISGQVGEAIKLLNDLPDTWLSDFDFTGPKALLLGDLLMIDGRKDLARIQYEAALAEARREQERSPTDLRVRRAEMWILLGLERTDEARAALRPLLQSILRPYRVTMNNSWWNGPVRAAFLLGDRDQAVALLRDAVVEAPSRMILRNQFHLDPRMAPFREDKEIVALLAEPEKPKAEDGGQAAAKVDEKSVAVLAFANLSDDKANEYFSDGISEELLNVLAKTPGLKVSARTSAFHFKGKDTPIPEIARQLGVAYVIEGSVRKQGNQVRITAQLIKAADGFHVWSDNFTRDLKDIFAVQDEIAGLIAKNLSLKLAGNASMATVDPDSFGLFLAGRQALDLRNSESYDRADALFTQVIERAPGFARAYAARAETGYLRANNRREIGLWPQRDSAQFDRWAKDVETALRLEPDLPEAMAVRGLINGARWRVGESVRDFRRAIELNSNYALARLWLGIRWWAEGRVPEARAELLRAAELDPMSATIASACSAFLHDAGYAAESLAQARRAVALQPNGTRQNMSLVHALALNGLSDEAIALIRKLMAGSDPWQPGRHFRILVRAGLKDEAERIYREKGQVYDLQNKTAALAALGRWPEFFEIWQVECVNPQAPFPLYDPIYDPIRKDPRFLAVLQEIGMADAHDRAQAWLQAHPVEKGGSK